MCSTLIVTFFSGTKSLDLLHENPAAHNAGITCMCLIVDQEFNAMLLTGMKKQNFYLTLTLLAFKNFE